MLVGLIQNEYEEVVSSMSSWVLQWLLLRVVAWLKNVMDDDLGTIIMDGEESSV
jgi:hypothetical protein